MSVPVNPFFSLDYDPALEILGDDYFDIVTAATFPMHALRFRNDALLPLLGLTQEAASDDDFIEAFGKFQRPASLLALRYHGYQFGEYNPFLGDGRGFLYGQVRGMDGKLYDFGTKGSGTTPYSRGGDGRLTLKGGVREVLAAEALHRLGVQTSRCLCLIETGESLWRGDEPSPTRSSVMVRVSRSHIRFGTFERLHYLGRKDFTTTLLQHVVEQYYPHLCGDADVYSQFYAELVQRVADLAAQWMVAGFCHGVLNTDNMSITGESFDYGPYAFIPTYNPKFTAAYFDYMGRYRYGNQPAVCRWNLQKLQHALEWVIPAMDMEASLARFEEYYQAAYCDRMLKRLGVSQCSAKMESQTVVDKTCQLLEASQVGYHQFFVALREQFSPAWRDSSDAILDPFPIALPEDLEGVLRQWREAYHRLLNDLPFDAMTQVGERLTELNPKANLLRPAIEAIWEPIVYANNWEPFATLVAQITA